MPHADLIDSLIATYRTLNLTIRQLGQDQVMKAGSDGKSIRDIIASMRVRELTASQQLKNMTLVESGTAMPSRDLAPPDPVDENNVRVLLSEFGTAREAILASIREMSDEQWASDREGPNGTTTVRQFIQDLVDQDRQVMNELQPLLPNR